MKDAGRDALPFLPRDYFFALRFLAVFFFAVFFFFAAFFGTFLPAALASDKPIAIACLRLLTFLPERPLFKVPALRFFIARPTLADAFFEYFRAMTFLPVAGKQSSRAAMVPVRDLAPDRLPISLPSDDDRRIKLGRVFCASQANEIFGLSQRP